MRVSGTLCVSALALAMVAATAGISFAAVVARSTTVTIDGSATAAKACTDKGGIVSTASGGQKSCTTSATACMSNNINVGQSTSIDINDTAAVRACFDACGSISTTQAGQNVCTKPDTMMPDASAPGREPSN
jgi:hypothetical protein